MHARTAILTLSLFVTLSVLNKAIFLIVAHLAKLPSNFRFIFTCRPDSFYGNIKPTVERAFQESCLFLEPHQVRQQELGQGADQVLVYKTVMTECNLGPETETVPTLDHLYAAYKSVFDRASDKDKPQEQATKVEELIRVLLVTCEPPPVSLLQGLNVIFVLTVSLTVTRIADNCIAVSNCIITACNHITDSNICPDRNSI